MGFGKKSMSDNIKTEMDNGKPQKQSVAIAYDIMRKAKAKKMARGGYVEEENIGHSDQHHFGNEHDSMPENYESDLHGEGFDEDDIDGHDEQYDVQPGRFASGGMAHPLGMLLRNKMLQAKKMAYGGDITPNDREEITKDYGEHEEENNELEHMHSGTMRPALHEAMKEPHEDRDRLAFMRSYLTRKALRR